MRCPSCGYHDPFMVSYWDHEKEVAEPLYFKEWDLEIWEELQKNSWIQVEEELMYHLTRNKVTVERWRIVDLMARKAANIQYDTKSSQRKNYHIIGKRLSEEAKSKQ